MNLNFRVNMLRRRANRIDTFVYTNCAPNKKITLYNFSLCEYTYASSIDLRPIANIYQFVTKVGNCWGKKFPPIATETSFKYSTFYARDKGQISERPLLRRKEIKLNLLIKYTILYFKSKIPILSALITLAATQTRGETCHTKKIQLIAPPQKKKHTPQTFA